MAGKEPPKDPKALPGSGTVVPEEGKKKGKLKKIAIIIAILLMVGAAAGGTWYWWFNIRKPAPVAEGDAGGAPVVEAEAQKAGSKNEAASPTPGTTKIERQTDIPRSTGKVLPLPEFMVNLSDPGGKRFLRLGMEVEVNSDVAKELQAGSARIRDAVIMLLAGKSLADISSPEGKVLLKAEVAARINQILGAQRVVRVYFTDFVIQ